MLFCMCICNLLSIFPLYALSYPICTMFCPQNTGGVLLPLLGVSLHSSLCHLHLTLHPHLTCLTFMPAFTTPPYLLYYLLCLPSCPFSAFLAAFLLPHLLSLPACHLCLPFHGMVVCSISTSQHFVHACARAAAFGGSFTYTALAFTCH